MLLGTLGIVAGVFLLSWPEKKRNRGGPENLTRGEYLLPLVSSVCYAIVPVFAKLGLAEQQGPTWASGWRSAQGFCSCWRRGA